VPDIIGVPSGVTMDRVELARRLVETLGGRFSAELGIDVDGGDPEIDRWFLAATLFGTRISLFDAGVHSIVEASILTRDQLVALLDAGGYARYDFRTADRLADLARVVSQRHGGRVASLGRELTDPAALAKALDALPGWGPVTVHVFLRELRGVWPGAALPLDERTLTTARHLQLLSNRTSARTGVERLAELAIEAAVHRCDLEAALVRCSIAHGRQAGCPGGARCTVLTAAQRSRTRQEPHRRSRAAQPKVLRPR
jgi:endonuclease III